MRVRKVEKTMELDSSAIADWSAAVDVIRQEWSVSTGCGLISGILILKMTGMWSEKVASSAVRMCTHMSSNRIKSSVGVS